MFCKLILPSNEIHKLSVLPSSYEDLHQVISNKLKDKIPQDFSLRYKDSDEELITLANDEDLQTAVLTANSEGLKTLRIFIIPASENLDALKINESLSLPRIPEALEKSRRSFGDLPLTQSPTKDTENKNGATSFSPFKRFDLNKLQKTRSLILDDVETVNSLTPFSEKPDVTSNRKVFTFQRIDSLDFASNVQDGILPNGILSEEQVKAIEALLDTKLIDRIQDRILAIAKDLITKLNEECGFLNNSSHHGGPPSRNIKRSNTQFLPELAQENLLCNGCNTDITGIKFLCLTCPNFFRCESCEPQADHSHPLLKVRPLRKQNSYLTRNDTVTQLNSMPKINPVSMIPYGVKGCGRYPGAKSGLMSFGSVANISHKPGRYENSNPNHITQQQQQPQAVRPANQLRRGMSLGSIMNPASSSSGPKIYRPYSDGEPRYQATIIKSTIYDIINVKPDQPYNLQLTVRNIGDEKWADKVKLVCINGFYKGNEVDIGNLRAGEEQIVTITLRAPVQIGRHLSQWKLHYYEDDIPRSFGKAICVDTDVSLKDKLYREETAEAPEENEEEDSNETTAVAREERNSRRRLTLVGNEAKEADKNLIRGLSLNFNNVITV